MRVRWLWLLLLLLLLPVRVSAQSAVVNPGGIEFTASADHATVVGGVPAVDHYEFVTVSASALTVTVFTRSLPKGTPDAQNKLAARIPEFASLSTGDYVGFVDAVGPGGSGRSAASAPFVRLRAPAPTSAPVPVP